MPEGGYYLWLELPLQYNSDEIMRVVEQDGVGIFSGQGFFASNPPGKFIRLCFATCTEPKIEEGVRQLGIVLQRLRTESAREDVEPTAHQQFD
jgi:DNA-binding transcriptional MocR family regulator